MTARRALTERPYSLAGFVQFQNVFNLPAHNDVVSRQAVRLLKYRDVNASESSHSVLLSSAANSSKATKFPSLSRRERSSILLERTKLAALTTRLCSVDSLLPGSLSCKRFIW